jgi:hypothetical protein
VVFTSHGWALPHKSITLLSVGAMSVQGLTWLLAGGLLVYYFVHLAQARQVPDEERLPWALLLVLGSVLVMPVYWFFHVWRPIDRISPSALYPPRD